MKADNVAVLTPYPAEAGCIRQLARAIVREDALRHPSLVLEIWAGGSLHVAFQGRAWGIWRHANGHFNWLPSDFCSPRHKAASIDEAAALTVEMLANAEPDTMPETAFPAPASEDNLWPRRA